MRERFLLSIDNIPGSFEQRVFIGGDYTNIAILREIRKLVSKLGFQPILLADFTIPTGEVFETAVFLLSRCKYVIFEVSTKSAAYMELVKCKDFKVRVLLIYQALFEPTTHKSSMIRSFVKSYKNAQLWSYPNFSEMKKIVKQWLSKEKSKGTE